MSQRNPSQLFDNTVQLHKKENPILNPNDAMQEAVRGVPGSKSAIRASLFLMPALYEQALRSTLPSIPDEDIRFLLAIHTLIRETFSKNRRSGESAAGHPIGVSLILMGELGEKNPRTIAYGLLHDYVEDVLWSDSYLQRHGRPELVSSMRGQTDDLHAKRVTFAVEQLRALKNTHDIVLDENDIAVVMALSIDKTHGEHYRQQIGSLQAAKLPAGITSGLIPRAKKATAVQMKDAAARVRIADKIANLRSGESDLATSPKAQKRLLKQAIGGYAHVVPLAQHIQDPEQQKALLSSLLQTIRATVETIVSLARSDSRWWPTFQIQSVAEIQLNQLVRHILADDQPRAYIRNRPVDELARTVLKQLE